MDNLESLATLGAQGTGRKKNQKHNTEHKKDEQHGHHHKRGVNPDAHEGNCNKVSYV